MKNINIIYLIFSSVLFSFIYLVSCTPENKSESLKKYQCENNIHSYKFPELNKDFFEDVKPLVFEEKESKSELSKIRLLKKAIDETDTTMYWGVLLEPLKTEEGLRKSIHLSKYITIVDLNKDSQSDIIFNYCEYDDMCGLTIWLGNKGGHKKLLRARGILTELNIVEKQKFKISVYGPGCCDAPPYTEMYELELTDSILLKKKLSYGYYERNFPDSIYNKTIVKYSCDTVWLYERPKELLQSSCKAIKSEVYGIIGEKVDSLTNQKWLFVIKESKNKYNDYEFGWIETKK
jgi:hypothetical protein